MKERKAGRNKETKNNERKIQKKEQENEQT